MKGKTRKITIQEFKALPLFSCSSDFQKSGKCQESVLFTPSRKRSMPNFNDSNGQKLRVVRFKLHVYWLWRRHIHFCDRVTFSLAFHRTISGTRRCATTHLAFSSLA